MMSALQHANQGSVILDKDLPPLEHIIQGGVMSEAGPEIADDYRQEMVY